MQAIDVHSHVIPPSLVELMRRGQAPDGITLEEVGSQTWVVHPQGYRYPLMPEFYDIGARIKSMDSLGIEAAILSIAPPLFLYWIEPDEAVEAARIINDAIAEMVGQAPDRFVGLMTLPLQTPRAAAEELKRCVNQLDLRGGLIGPHCEGINLDDMSLRPVLSTAEKEDVPLVVHPYYVGSTPGLDDFYLTNLQGNPWQSAVCASRLIFSGTLDDLDRLKIVLVHGGGHLLYQIGRLDHGYKVRPETKTPKRMPSEYLRNFYFDSLTHRPDSTSWLIDQVGADRVLFGTDMPFDMAGPSLKNQLQSCRLSNHDLSLISSENAIRIFGPIKKRSPK